MPWANRHRGEYPADWAEIATKVKDEEGWKCERCDQPHVNDAKTGHMLTVHHLDGNKSNVERWNLAALCQRCHLRLEIKVNMDQLIFDFRVRPWFRKHYEGWQRSCAATGSAHEQKGGPTTV